VQVFLLHLLDLLLAHCIDGCPFSSGIKLPSDFGASPLSASTFSPDKNLDQSEHFSVSLCEITQSKCGTGINMEAIS